MILGRHEEISQLRLWLANGISAAVVGPSGFGKTALCTAVLQNAEVDSDLNAVAVFINARWTLTPNELAREIVVRAVVSISRFEPDITAVFSPETHTSDPLVAKGQSILWSLEDQLSEAEFVGQALEFVEEIAGTTNRAVVLCIDDFDYLIAPAGPYGKSGNSLRLLRAILQRSSRIVALFSMRSTALLDRAFHSKNESLFRFVRVLELQPLQPKAAADLLRLHTDLPIAWDPDAVTWLVLKSGGVPHVILQLAQAVTIHTLQNAAQVISLADVQQAFEEVMRDHDSSLERAIDGARRDNKHAPYVLRSMAMLDAPYVGDLNPAQVQRSLQALERMGLVRESEQGWRIQDPMLAEHIRRQTASQNFD